MHQKMQMKSKIFIFSADLFLLGALLFLYTALRTSSVELPPDFISSLIMSIVIIWFVYYAISGYDFSTDMLSLSYSSQHIIAGLVALTINVVGIYAMTFTPNYQHSRSVLPLTYISFIPISLYYRRLISRKTISLMKDNFYLIMGVTQGVKELFEDYTAASIPQQLRIISLSENSPDNYLCGSNSPRIEKMKDSFDLYMNNNCSGIILTDNEIDEKLMNKLTEVHFKGVPVMSIEKFYEKKLQRVFLKGLSHAWLLKGGFILVGESAYEKIKRMFDILLAVIALIAASPVFLILPPLILFDGKGPAIFRQTRIGKNERHFTLYKFRTMRSGSDEGDVYTRENDERVTAFGKILRKLRIDELPQLINVLKGDMSMIGPRAEWVKLTADYEKKIPYYHFRHLVRPGITGWAQVNYPYGENLSDTIEKLQYDLYYVRHHSLLLDFKIILKTIYIVFFGKGR